MMADPMGLKGKYGQALKAIMLEAIEDVGLEEAAMDLFLMSSALCETAMGRDRAAKYFADIAFALKSGDEGWKALDERDRRGTKLDA
jgi:hypothetical protein